MCWKPAFPRVHHRLSLSQDVPQAIPLTVCGETWIPFALLFVCHDSHAFGVPVPNNLISSQCAFICSFTPRYMTACLSFCAHIHAFLLAWLCVYLSVCVLCVHMQSWYLNKTVSHYQIRKKKVSCYHFNTNLKALVILERKRTTFTLEQKVTSIPYKSRIY